MKLADMDKSQLQAMKADLEKQYGEFKARGLKLNMARGKPASAQLDLSMGLLTALDGVSMKDADGADVRNYGGLNGIPEARALFGEIFGMPADQVIIGGSASLNLMYDTISRAFL
ncbi:MAG: aminotransferase, partial [Clostridiales bacterium]